MTDNNDNKNGKLYLVNMEFYLYQNGVIPVFAENEEGVRKWIEEQMAASEHPPRDLNIISIVESQPPKDDDALDELLAARAGEIEAETTKKVLN